MMNNAWKINDGDRTYGKGWKGEEGSPSKNPKQSFDAKGKAAGSSTGQGPRP